jgi:hypothetical protein
MDDYSFKPEKKISATAWRQKLAQAERLEIDDQFDSAIDSYKFIYSETIARDLQKVASDAASGIVSTRIRSGKYLDAINEVSACLSEIDHYFVTAKLLRQLATAYILEKNIVAAAFVIIFGASNLRQHPYFLVLMMHFEEHYAESYKSLTDHVKRGKKLFNSIKAKDICETCDKLPKSEISIDYEDQIRKDLHSFLQWGAICPDDKEKQAIKGESLKFPKKS